MNEGDITKLLFELQALNKNFQESGQDMKRLVSRLRDLSDQFKAILPLARQISILNQILLQVRKSAGTSAMVQSLLDGFLRMAK